jgi:hypothetical protein
VKQDPTIQLTVAASCTASNGASLTFRFDVSNDLQAWVTNALAFSVTLNGTSPIVSGTNFNAQGSPWLRLRQIENPGPAAATNILLTGWTKTLWSVNPANPGH